MTDTRNKGRPSLTKKNVLDIRRKDVLGNYVAPVSYFTRVFSMSAEHIRRIRRGEVYAYITEGLEEHTEGDPEVLEDIEKAIEEAAQAPAPISAEMLESLHRAVTLAAEPDRKPSPRNPYLLDPSEREDSAISANINSANSPKEPSPDAKQPTDPSQQQPSRPGYGDAGRAEDDPSLD